MDTKRRRILVFLLKALVTAACLWWLSRYFDYEQVRTALGGTNPLLLVLAIMLHFLSFVAGGVRWWLLFRHLGAVVTFRRVWPSYYLGVFYNNLLPSLYGGDIARTARLYSAGMSGSALVSSAFFDRLLGMVAIIAMGVFAMTFSPAAIENSIAAGVFGLGLLVVLLLAALMMLPRWATSLDSGLGQPWPRLHAVLACFPRFRESPGLLLTAFGLSVLNQLLVVLVFMLLAPGLGVDLPVFQFMVVLVLVLLIASLPISLGGLGAREAAMMSLLLPLGVEPAPVIALSIAYLLVLWACTLPGAFMLLLNEPDMRDTTTA